MHPRRNALGRRSPRCRGPVLDSVRLTSREERIWAQRPRRLTPGAAADVEAAAKRLTAAEQAHELAQTLEALSDPAVDEELRGHGEAIAAALADVRDRVLLVRGHLARSATLAARARELGQTDARPHDGLAVSVGLASKLSELGGAVASSDPGHSLRWPVMAQVGDTDALATRAVRELAGAVTEVLEQGARHQRAGIDHGRASLERLASVWAGHREYNAAREALEVSAKADGAARQAADRRAHEKRLMTLKVMPSAGPDQATRARNAAAKAAQAQIDAELDARIGPEAIGAAWRATASPTRCSRRPRT